MKKNLEILKRCPLFDGMTDEELSAMLGCLGARQESFAKGQTVLAEGDPVRAVGIVLSGSAQIVRVDYYGNRSIVATLSPAQLFGEAFAFAGVPVMPVSVVATQPLEALLLDPARITEPCQNACGMHNRLIRNLLGLIAKKNLLFHQKLEITSRRTTREKLMTYLLLQAKRAGSSHFAIPFDRQALADYLEVERSGLSAEIGKLRREGVLDCNKNEFTLR